MVRARSTDTLTFTRVVFCQCQPLYKTDIIIDYERRCIDSELRTAESRCIAESIIFDTSIIIIITIIINGPHSLLLNIDVFH